MLDTKHPDMTRLISSRTTLKFKEWNSINQARLGILPLNGAPGYQPSNKSCRPPLTFSTHAPQAWLRRPKDTAGCWTRLAKSIEKAGHKARINRSWGEGRLRPDLVITTMDHHHQRNRPL